MKLASSNGNAGEEDDIFGRGGRGKSVASTEKIGRRELDAEEERSRAMTDGDNMMDMFDGGGTDAIAAASAPSASSCQPGLLDLEDIFGGGAAADPPAAAAHNRSLSTEAKPEPAAGQSDVNLLSDIFSAPPVVTATGRSRRRQEGSKYICPNGPGSGAPASIGADLFA